MAVIIIALFVDPPRIRNVKKFSNESGRELYGRTEMLAEVIDALDNFTFVSVCGVPGVGKSTLVQNALQILQQECYVQIVDGFELQNISSLIEHLYSSFNMNENPAYKRKSSAERIAELLRNIIIQLKTTTILVFYNLDGEWHIQQDQLHNLLIHPLLMPEIQSKFKVIVTSQHCFKLKGPYHKIIPLSGISDDSCADWISTEYSVISYSNSKQLCHILGGIPLAVKMVASFIADPSRSHEYTADKVISNLSSSEFGYSFKYLIDKHKIISEDSSLMKALFLVYDSLDIKYRQCIFLLASLRSDRLPHEYIVSFFQSEDENFPNECIEKLLTLSLIEKVSNSNSTQYRLNYLVMNFIQWLEEPKVGDTFKQMARRFWGNVVQHYVKEKRIILNEERDVQLAAQIGSNKYLINSLLPLLGKKFTLMPLFKHALNIIHEQFCRNGFWNKRQRPSDLIFAFSHLTKVVYCPEYHPTSLLMRQESQNTSTPPNSSCSATSRCFKKLTECGRELEMLYNESVRNDISVAEAFAHYNTLLILSSCNKTLWRSSLFDLAMTITTANIQCKLYCQRARICSCGTQTSFELGLFEFLLNNNNLSKHYLHKELESQMTDDYYHCQTILKTLAVMIIHVINQLLSRNDIDAQVGSALYFKRLRLNYYQLDATCYLCVVKDLILPFLREVHPDQEAIAILHQKLQENISQEYEVDEYPLSRYALFFGLIALKTAQLQEEFEWPEKVEWIEPREAWVCSIIKDKTKKCQDSIKLPLLNKVKSTEAFVNDKTFFSLNYLMEEEEFFEWDEKVKNIPGFYQYMSI